MGTMDSLARQIVRRYWTERGKAYMTEEEDDTLQRVIAEVMGPIINGYHAPEYGVLSALDYALTFTRQMPTAVAKRLTRCREHARSVLGAEKE